MNQGCANAPKREEGASSSLTQRTAPRSRAASEQPLCLLADVLSNRRGEGGAALLGIGNQPQSSSHLGLPNLHRGSHGA
jgi:hypothetical protein